MMAMVSNYPDTLDETLQRLLEELEVIEDHILDDRHRGERRRLMIVRRESAQLHRHTRALRRCLSLAERTVSDLPSAMPIIIQRLIHLDQDFDSLESRARFFHDEIDAKLSAETNRQLYILSVLTAGFLPPTLVAGLFGMNLQGMPWSQSQQGFWIAVGLSLLSSAAVGLFLWRANRN
jgi:Mg2+ and Co2+ transporter CorA